MSTSEDTASAEAARTAFRECDAVCFDVDSTVISEEGIDVLADHLGKGEEVAALTKAAMEGGMKFQDALQARLDLLQPSKSQIQDLLDRHPPPLTPGMDSLVKTLQDQKKSVYLVSGGFRIMIEPIAELLGIPPQTHVIANHILFDEDGTYAGFDPNEPTSRDMGKPKAVQQIMDRDGHSSIVMVGDGSTDAQAKPPATAFVGFGGVIVRESVKAKADWYVMSMKEMEDELRSRGTVSQP